MVKEIVYTVTEAISIADTVGASTIGTFYRKSDAEQSLDSRLSHYERVSKDSNDIVFEGCLVNRSKGIVKTTGSPRMIISLRLQECMIE